MLFHVTLGLLFALTRILVRFCFHVSRLPVYIMDLISVVLDG